MDIELISVESDLLLTDVRNHQMAYITEKCAQLGMPVVCQMRIEYENTHLPELIRASVQRSKVVILVCGEGKEPGELKKIVSTQVLKKQTEPSQNIPLERHGGKYNGWILEEEDKSVVILPEEEVQDIFEKELFCRLQKKQEEAVYYATLKMCGISSSKVKEILADIQKKYPDVKITVTCKSDDIRIHLMAKATEEHLAKKMLKPVTKACMEKFEKYIYTTDDGVSLEAAVLSLLKERDLTLTTAESLTGGLLAARFTAVPGASEVFKQGFVTYCNRAKRKLLDVKKTTLKEHGAVSERTAKEMAKNGVFATGADACISLTGLAGPAAEEGKPVGLVYIACCYKNRTVVREHHFKGNRSQIREQSATQALILLRDCILADQ